MRLVELTNEQRRQVIDVDQAFTVWREAARKAVPGSLRWVTRKGVEYLYRKSGKSERSLGRRSKATEAIMSEHNQLRSRIRQTGARLKVHGPGQSRSLSQPVPKDAALILRELDTAGLLGKHLFVIGTNALYAYEMKAAVLFESSLLATSDFDLLWDAREQSRLLVTGMSPEGVTRGPQEGRPDLLGCRRLRHPRAERARLFRRSVLSRCDAGARQTGTSGSRPDSDRGRRLAHSSAEDRRDCDWLGRHASLHALRRSTRIRPAQAVAVKAAEPPGAQPSARYCPSESRCRRRHRLAASQVH